VLLVVILVFCWRKRNATKSNIDQDAPASHGNRQEGHCKIAQTNNSFEMVDNVLYTSRDTTQQNKSKVKIYNQLNHFQKQTTRQVDAIDEYSHIENCNKTTVTDNDQQMVYNEIYFSKDHAESNMYILC